MRFACIWNREAERLLIEHAIQGEQPDWRVVSIRYTEVASLEKLLLLLKDDYAAILLHLSLPQCAALKLAELCHRDQLKTRIILTSRTDADHSALEALFAGCIHPDDDLLSLATKIRSSVSSPSQYLPKKGIENAIVSIFNSDNVLSMQFRQRFGELYRGAFTFDDYRRFAQAVLVDDAMALESSTTGGVFISYAVPDEPLAQELYSRFAKRGIKVFLASRDIPGGTPWEPTIRDALLRCSELLVIVTPLSKDRPWVMIEAGAAWALGKPITPCTAYVDITSLPDALSKFQSRPIVTQRDKDLLVREVVLRARSASLNRVGTPDAKVGKLRNSMRVRTQREHHKLK